jgi:hypothetical protein
MNSTNSIIKLAPKMNYVIGNQRVAHIIEPTSKEYLTFFVPPNDDHHLDSCRLKGEEIFCNDLYLYIDNNYKTALVIAKELVYEEKSLLEYEQEYFEGLKTCGASALPKWAQKKLFEYLLSK